MKQLVWGKRVGSETKNLKNYKNRRSKLNKSIKDKLSRMTYFKMSFLAKNRH